MRLCDPFSVNAGAFIEFIWIHLNLLHEFCENLTELFLKHEGKKNSTQQKLYILN